MILGTSTLSFQGSRRVAQPQRTLKMSLILPLVLCGAAAIYFATRKSVPPPPPNERVVVIGGSAWVLLLTRRRLNAILNTHSEQWNRTMHRSYLRKTAGMPINPNLLRASRVGRGEKRVRGVGCQRSLHVPDGHDGRKPAGSDCGVC